MERNHRSECMGTITISYPAANPNVANNFSAGGFKDDATRQVKAWLTQVITGQGLTTIANGTAGTFNPAVVDWEFDFQVDNQYSGPATLNVDYTTGTSALAQQNLFLGGMGGGGDG